MKKEHKTCLEDMSIPGRGTLLCNNGVCGPIFGDKKGPLQILENTPSQNMFSMQVYPYLPSTASKKWYFVQHKMVSTKMVSIILIYFENFEY